MTPSERYAIERQLNSWTLEIVTKALPEITTAGFEAARSLAIEKLRQEFEILHNEYVKHRLLC